MSLSIGLDIAAQAVRMQQLAVDTTSHNIANANTPGFSRQDVHLRALNPLMTNGTSYDRILNQVGRGVNVRDVRRLRDAFVDLQIRNVLNSAGQYRAQADALQKVEIALGEPSDTGLGALLSKFWNSWRDLSNAPESSAARAGVLQNTEVLVQGFHRVSGMLARQREDINMHLSQDLEEVNTLSTNLAALNDQIRRSTLNNVPANDLSDQRDLILDRLSQLIGATSVAGEDGMVDVFFNGQQLVSATSSFRLTTRPEGDGMLTPVFEDGGLVVQFGSGEVAGLLRSRDVLIPAQAAKVDQVAAAVIAQVNALHSTSYGLDNTTGNNFFTGTSAATIAIDAAVENSPQSIAASATAGTPGDGSRALAIAGLQQALTMNGNTASIEDFYRSFIGELGIQVSEARNLADNEDAVMTHLDDLRQSVSGVNLDEEMVNLTKYQHAFNAAARLVAIADEMIGVLVNLGRS